MHNTFLQYQYDDLLNRDDDAYATTKYQIILEYLKKENKTNSNFDILNVGCGSGDLSILLKQAGYRVVGIDPSPEYIELARRRALQSGVDCRFEVGAVEDWGNDFQYDYVVATDVLEHIQDDYKAIEKMFFLTKKSGSLIITVPALQSLFGYHDEQLGHYRRYSKKTLSDLICSLPLVSIDYIRYFGLILIPISYLFSCLLKRPYPTQGGKKGGRTIKSYILNLLLRIEKAVRPPLGTSIIAFISRN